MTTTPYYKTTYLYKYCACTDIERDGIKDLSRLKMFQTINDDAKECKDASFVDVLYRVENEIDINENEYTLYTPAQIKSAKAWYQKYHTLYVAEINQKTIEITSRAEYLSQEHREQLESVLNGASKILDLTNVVSWARSYTVITQDKFYSVNLSGEYVAELEYAMFDDNGDFCGMHTVFEEYENIPDY